MTSAVFSFLLLMLSSSLLISTANVTPSANKKDSPQAINKAREVLKETAKFVQNNIGPIVSTVGPFLGMIPVCGTAISALFNLVGLIKKNEDMSAFINEFTNLNSKLGHYHAEQKWDNWAASVYYKPEMDIKVAWSKYNTLMQGLVDAKDDDIRANLKKEFKKIYSIYEPAIQTLHELLTATGTTFINRIGDELAEHVKCHEKDIREYIEFINQLIYKGITMNEFYYKLMNTATEAKADDEAWIAYKAASVMFEVHKKCIASSMNYVKKDVEMLIDKNTKRSDQAELVWLFLDEVYDRYDWMVVAFKSKNSRHKIAETINSHVLTGFTEVTKDSISVAVARQVKGTHTKAAVVKKAIEKCIDKSVLCYKVAKMLEECTETVENKTVSQTYTAVHAYLRDAHDSHNAQEAPDENDEVSANPEDSSIQTPYIYSGKCHSLVTGGKFVVLIKSDEEIMTNDPCSKLNCGGDGRGTCVSVEGVFLPVCNCKMPYYGQNCEQSLDDYKRYLMGKSEL